MTFAADFSEWFPHSVGDQWTYEHYDKSGDRNRPDVKRWTTVQTVRELLPLPEGLVILLQVAVTSGMPSTAWIGHSAQRGYLLRDRCLYGLDEGWDQQKRTLTDDFRRDLFAGILSPEFCFPLEIGQQWSGADGRDRVWRVEGMGSGVGGPQDMPTDAYRLGSSIQGPWRVWFKKGVGVVGEWYSHSGTYGEYGKALKLFVPAAPQPNEDPDSSPFTRFNFKARKAVFRAIIEAHAFQASRLETEHLLLGIIGLGAEYQRDPADERAVTRLFGSSERADAIRTAIESELPSRPPRPGSAELAKDLPLSRAVRHVFRNCLDQAGAMGHQYTGVEHLLLAIILEEESLASRVLRDHGVSEATLRAEIDRVISSGERFDSLGPEF